MRPTKIIFHRVTQPQGVSKYFLRRKINLALFGVLLSICLSACGNARAGRQFELGQKLHTQGAYLEAIRNWEIILSSWPKSRYADQALHRIGTTYYAELDQPDRALDSFSRLVKDYPDSQYAPQDEFLVAEIYRSQRQFAKALAEYYRFLHKFPEDGRAPEVWYNMITCLFEVGQYDAMRTQAQDMMKKFPNSAFTPDCIFWIGESYYLEKDYAKAMSNFRDYLKKYPSGTMAYKAWLSLARSLEESEQLQEAIKLYQQLQARYPQDKIIQARLQSAQKRYENRFGSIKPGP
jgi:TolA-binding protein